MHKFSLFTICLALGLTQAATTTSSTPTTSCYYATPSTAPIGYVCGLNGTLTTSLVSQLSVASVANVAACAGNCWSVTACGSFGYNATGGSCTLYGKSLAAMGFLSVKTGDTIYYKNDCWLRSCSTVGGSKTTTTSSTSTSSTTTSSSISTSATSSSASASSSASTASAAQSTSATSSSVSASSLTSTASAAQSTSTSNTTVNTPNTFTNTTTSGNSSTPCGTIPSSFLIALYNTSSFLTPSSTISTSQALTLTQSPTTYSLFSLNSSTSQLTFSLADGTSRLLYSEQDYAGAGDEDIYFAQGYAEEEYGYMPVQWNVDEDDCTLSVGVDGVVGSTVVQVCQDNYGAVVVALRTVANAAAQGSACYTVTLELVEADY